MKMFHRSLTNTAKIVTSELGLITCTHLLCLLPWIVWHEYV